MKKRSILFFFFASLLICLLAITASAKTIYQDENGNELFWCVMDSSSAVTEYDTTKRFDKVDGDGNALTWYLTGNTSTDAEGNTIKEVASVKTTEVFNMETGKYNDGNTFAYTVVSANFDEGLTKFGTGSQSNTGIFGGYSSRSYELLFVYIPDSVTAVSERFCQFVPSVLEINFSENSNCATIGKHFTAQAYSLRKFRVPSKVTYLPCEEGYGFFQDCKRLEEIIFDPNMNLETVGLRMFYNCSSLKEIILPNTVKYVHNRAFQCYTGKGVLETVNLGASFQGFVYTSDIGTDTWYFYNQPYLKEIYIPALSAENVTADWRQLINESATPEIKYTGTLESWTAVLEKIKEVANNKNGTILGITNPTIITTCEAFYEGNHTGKEAVKFTDGMFVSNANLCIECTRCGNTEEIETVAPLFHFNGFSYEESTGSGKVMQAFAINKSVLDFYTEKFGAISYGLVAAVNTYYVDETPNILHDGTLFDVTDGALVAREKVAYVDFTERNYEIFEIAISGLAGNNQNTSVYLCAYAFIDGKVYYLNDESVNEGTAGSSFTIADIKAKVDA